MDSEEKRDESSLKMPQGEETKIDYSALNPPEPMGGQSKPVSTGAVKSPSVPPASPPPSGPLSPPPTPPPTNFEPPHRPIVPFLLMIFLSLIVVMAILVFFSWKGWIKIGQNFWHKSTPTPTASPTSSISLTPSNAASPEIIANVNDQIRKKDLENLQDALKLYFVEKGNYPSTDSVLIKTSDSNSVLAQALVLKYLEKLPDDPLAPSDFYGYKSDGTSFELTCVLEDTSDPDGARSGNLYLYKITNTN